MKCESEGGLALALQINLVSLMLKGDKVRVLENVGWEPNVAEMSTRAVLLDNRLDG